MIKIKNLFLAIKEEPGQLIVLLLAAVLRLVNLGYSDFQGDEIKALYLPGADEKWYEFLLTQRKGPIQFLITYLIKFIDPFYTNQFLVRIPFAIAGVLAVLVFYKLVRRMFGKKIAFYAGILLATNGFFIAFARIAQYQSFVILFSVLAVYYMHLAITEERFKTKGIYLAALYWALSILSHYDGAFIAPILVYLGFLWFKNTTITYQEKTKALIFASGLFMLLNLAFYIPFVLYISQGTTAYWLGRLTGGASEKLSSSYYLFTVYQPIYVIHIYLGFFILGLISLFGFLMKPLQKMSSINTKEDLYNIISVFGWFFPPFILWEVIVYISGTHIYTYILPAIIIISHGIVFSENLWLSITRRVRFIKPRLVKNFGLTLMFLFVAAQAYYVFVDNYSEYPWEQENFLIWTLPVPTPSYHLSMFGFPYFRDWENIGKFISDNPSVTHYSTNERDSISRHYIHLLKDANIAGYYIYIRNPQTFTNAVTNEKVLYWTSKYPPVYTMSKNGADLVNIYLMETGPLADLQRKGF